MWWEEPEGRDAEKRYVNDGAGENSGSDVLFVQHLPDLASLLDPSSPAFPETHAHLAPATLVLALRRASSPSSFLTPLFWEKGSYRVPGAAIGIEAEVEASHHGFFLFLQGSVGHSSPLCHRLLFRDRSSSKLSCRENLPN